MGLIMTPVLLCFVFYLVFAPIGTAFRLARYDVLDRRFNTSHDSYWQAKEKTPDDPHRYERQY